MKLLYLILAWAVLCWACLALTAPVPDACPRRKHIAASTGVASRGAVLNFPWYWAVWSQKHNVVAVTPAKAMHTSVFDTFDRLECAASADPLCTSQMRNHSAISRETKWAVLKTAVRVLFIRDPFERALSAYKNSDTNQYIRAGHCSSWRNCTFEEWVRVIKTRGTRINEHFATQAQTANLAAVHYDYVFRVSSALDRKCFWSMVGIEEDVHKNASPKESMQEKLRYFPHSVVKMLREIYHVDIALWRMAQQWREDTPGESTVLDYLVN